MAFALSSFPVIIFMGGWVETDGRKRREEERPFQSFVPGMADALGLD